MVIYAFYMIFFLKDETGITKAKQILKWVIIAITIMGLSWFIVSMIYWIQSNSANTPNGTITTEWPWSNDTTPDLPLNN
jgi:NADH:ubiquinone oxidoreductase subunit 6 (subunit J)